MSINKVFFSGNIGGEPELRQTQAGSNVLTFRVAVNDRQRNSQTGEWGDYTNWVGCTMFGNRAQTLSQYLHSGTKVFIDGKLHYSQWEAEGQKRSKLEVWVDEIEFNNRDQGQQANGYQQGGYQQPQVGGYGSYGGYSTYQ